MDFFRLPALVDRSHGSNSALQTVVAIFALLLIILSSPAWHRSDKDRWGP